MFGAVLSEGFAVPQLDLCSCLSMFLFLCLSDLFLRSRLCMQLLSPPFPFQLSCPGVSDCLRLSQSTRLSPCLPVSVLLSLRLSVSPPVSVRLSVSPSVSVNPSLCVSVLLSLRLSQSACLSLRLSQSVCLSVSQVLVVRGDRLLQQQSGSCLSVPQSACLSVCLSPPVSVSQVWLIRGGRLLEQQSTGGEPARTDHQLCSGRARPALLRV